MTWVYDLEVYSNFFSATFKNYKTKEVKQYIISEIRNDISEIVKFVDNPHLWLIGYNSSNYDNQLLKLLVSKYRALETALWDDITQLLYEQSWNIIHAESREYIYNIPFQSIDLMKVGNFYKKSLKLIGTIFKWPKLQDLPIAPDERVKVEDITMMLKYNLNDVEMTEYLAYLLKDAINLRINISKEYDIKVYSESDSGIANKLLEKFYCDNTGLQFSEFKDLRTKRGKIFFGDVIMPDITFRTKEMNTVLAKLRRFVMYESVPFMKQTFVLHGTKYAIGVGGLHSDDPGDLFEKSDEFKIIDCDVSSYYPSMIINNRIHPAHLGDDFINQYEGIMKVRFDAKAKAKDKSLSKEELTKYKAIDKAFKLVLNSSYGKMKYEHHWLYDPLAALKITINCQLYLLMLIEYLGIKGFNVISANTDGIVTLVPPEREDEYTKICEQWESFTNFNLEYTEYSKLARLNVNNYLAVTVDGDVKKKGEFTYPDIETLYKDPLMLARGFDKPIISIALYKYFVDNIPIEDTIRGHEDIYDFCVSKKTDKKFTNIYHTLKNNELHVEELQQSVRYYISTNGGTLYKRSKENASRLINYCVGKQVTVFNDYVNREDYDINYSYYISETQKLIDQIIKPQLKLF